MITIDLNSLDGNALMIVSTFANIAKQIGYSKNHIEKVKKEMLENEYPQLVGIFMSHCGNFVELVNSTENIDKAIQEKRGQL